MQAFSVDFKLNFLGLFVADFDSSYHFYSEVLGIETKHATPGWAAFKTFGMKFELFSGGKNPSSERSWGNGVALRPSFQVADLKTTV